MNYEVDDFSYGGVRVAQLVETNTELICTLHVGTSVRIKYADHASRHSVRKYSRAKHPCTEIPLCESSPCERFSYCIKGNIYLTRAPVKVSRVQLSCAKVSRAVIYTCGDLSCGNQYVQGIGPYDHHIYVMSPTLNLTLTPRPYSHPGTSHSR